MSEAAASVTDMTSADLTETEAAMLELERSWWQFAGAKEQVIRRQFGISATAYYQRLNVLLDKPSALAHDPLTVRRLSRIREQRQRGRSARREA